MGSQQVVPSEGPTSFAAVGGHYNKRSLFATMDQTANQRLAENSQFAQLQKQMQSKGTIGWGSYNYPFSSKK